MASKILIYNLAVIALFVMLAHLCDKWWISLLAILFVYGNISEPTPTIIQIKREEEKEDDADE